MYKTVLFVTDLKYERNSECNEINVLTRKIKTRCNHVNIAYYILTEKFKIN